MFSIFNEFVTAFNNEDDEDTLVDCLKGLKELTNVPDEDFLLLVSGLKSDSTPSLIATMSDFLESKNEHIFHNALRYFGGITAAEDSRIPALAVKHGVLDRITNLMYSSNNNIVKECVWTISNITATNGCGL